MKTKGKSQSQSILPKTKIDKRESNINDTEKRQQIPRNVNYYSHFLKEHYIREKDIEWVLHLRNLDNSEMAARLQRIPNIGFSKADQKLESQKYKHLPRDVTYHGNSTPVMHLLKNRIGPTPHISQAEFETGLRSYATKDQSLLEKERNWTTVPKTQRHQEFPEFLPDVKEVITKKKSLSINGGRLSKITYSAFDPDTHLPPYEMKFQDKNIQNVRHMFIPNTKMSTIQWQNGLRPIERVKRQVAQKDK